MIFDLIFGKSYGKVHCPFHEGDDTPSLNIASDGRWHCFACGAGGGSETSFAQQYYSIANSSAFRFTKKLNSLPRYKYQDELAPSDIAYLNSIGISEEVQKKMMRSTAGKLVYPHHYMGVIIDHTWFNYPGSVTYSPKHGKYSRDYGSVSGFLTPHKLVSKDTIIIVEGEKDMLTMLSNKIPAVTIVGGANTLPYMMQRELVDKNVVIIYDCDSAGREGAATLVHWLYSIGVKSIKNVDLGLEDKEDISDWFIKYEMGRENLIKLINATPVAESTAIGSMKVFKMYRQITKQLSEEEQEELKVLLNKEGTEDAE
jgi:DNA primase